jgi:hypothetical protein
MATGSGKTFTLGNFLQYIFDNQTYQNFQILVLNDQVDIVEQLKKDFIDGDPNK